MNYDNHGCHICNGFELMKDSTISISLLTIRTLSQFIEPVGLCRDRMRLTKLS